MLLSPADLVDALGAGLARAEAALRLEQAVHGFDALDELGLHPLLQAALRDAGYGVHPEQRYPGQRARVRRSEGGRCDLVVTEDGRPLREPDRPATLFDDERAVELEEAFWLEVKTIAQFVPGAANHRYAAELSRPPRGDVTKLASDSLIRHAGVLLVLFAESASIAEHDLAVWERAAVREELPIAPPRCRVIDLLDRIGHRACVLALYPVHCGDGASP